MYNFYTRRTDPALTEEGGLHVNVFDNNRGRPVTNARIEITPMGDISDILDTKTTDDSGTTRSC